MSLVHDNLSGGQESLASLATDIKAWGRALGFDEVGIADTGLAEAEAGLVAWLEAGCHGQMDYMYKHGVKRSRPEALVPGTRRVISARMSYLPDAEDALAVLGDSTRAYVSRYALGRDYHKVLRARLQKLADRIAEVAPHAARVFVDSAPVMEVALAEKAGLGWRGKHTLLLSRQAGSFFFLGEIYTDLPLPVDAAPEAHCGRCSACISACPTGAIVAPYRVDALTFAFGSGIAGIAGVALSQIDNVSPNLGTGYIIDSFLVVVFGGVGSLAGTLIAAFGLGVINKMLEPWAGAVLAKVFVLVAVMVFIQRRPRGLFPQKGRAAEA